MEALYFWRAAADSQTMSGLSAPSTTLDFQALYESLPGVYVVLAPDLTILAATDACLAAIGARREAVVGRSFFEIFPDDPKDPSLAGGRTARENLEGVLRTGKPRWVTIERTENVQAADGGDRVERRYWSRVTSPVHVDGRLVYLITRFDDVTDAVRNARKTRESALVLKSINDGVLGIDLNGRATFLNPAGERMLGRTLQSFEGRNIHDTIHHSYPDGTPWPEAECDVYRAIARGRRLRTAEGMFWRADGTSFPVEYSAMPYRDEQGNFLGAVMTFRDVTERQEVERLKNEFVSTVSHELRTPLTSIRAALGLLDSGRIGELGEKARRMIHIAVSNTDRLIRLISEILDLERIESGRLAPKAAEVSASALLRASTEGLLGAAESAGVRIELALRDATLSVDEDQIVQTLTNLIGNAIKFSPRQSAVTVSGAPDGEMFRFRVADRGRGVPEDKWEAIFERFKQVDASDSRDKGGSGLGLAICRSIVLAHRGRIWVEANGEQGSIFQFTVPLARRR